MSAEESVSVSWKERVGAPDRYLDTWEEEMARCSATPSLVGVDSAVPSVEGATATAATSLHRLNMKP